MTEVYPGTIVRADKDGFHRLPWYESDTAYGPTGGTRLPDGTVARAKLKKRRGYGVVPPTLHEKRTPSQRAEHLAQLFVGELRKREQMLGRPLHPDDLSEQFLRAFGLEFWKAGEPITVEQMRGVAKMYLEGAKRGAAKDARWHPR